MQDGREAAGRCTITKSRNRPITKCGRN